MQNESQNCGTFVMLLDLTQGEPESFAQAAYLKEHNTFVEIFATFEIYEILARKPAQTLHTYIETFSNISYYSHSRQQKPKGFHKK